MMQDHNARRSNLPQEFQEFIDSPEGKIFLKQRAKLAALTSLLIFFTLCIAIISFAAKSNVNYLHPHRGNIFIYLAGGLLLGQIPIMVLYHQIILSQLKHKVTIPPNAHIRMPFQNPKVQIATVLSILLIIAGVISCLTA